jgi:hypothetical protein
MMSSLSDNEKLKIQPKLRMIADGSKDVNIVRAEQSSVVAVEKIEDVAKLPFLRGDEPVFALAMPPTPPRLEQLAKDIRVNVFVETNAEGAGLLPSLRGKPKRGNIVAATISLDELPEIAQHPNVLNIELGDPISVLTPARGCSRVWSAYSNRSGPQVTC